MVPSESEQALGSSVTWFPKAERWRIEITGSPTLEAVFIAHATLVRITDVDTHDPDLVAGLVQIHHVAIEESINAAAVAGWPERLGVLPKPFIEE